MRPASLHASIRNEASLSDVVASYKVANASGEPLEKSSSDPNGQLGRKLGSEEKDVLKVIETLGLQMKEEKEILVLRSKKREKQIEEMKVKIEMIEQENRAQGEKIRALEAELLTN